MALHRTTRDLIYPQTHAYPQFTLPQGTIVILIKDADGIKGDLWAVRSPKVIMDLTGNTHDPKYRYTWVPADAVEEVK